MKQPADMSQLTQAIRAAMKQGECDLGRTLLAQAMLSDTDGTHAELLADLSARLTAKEAHDARVAGQQAIADQDYALAREQFARLDTLVPDHPWANRLLRWTTGLAPDFADRLAAAQPHVRRRAFITGCGRSGTWMLAAMLAGLKDIRMLSGERPLGDFLWMPDEDAIHVLKRQHDAHRYFDRIPQDMWVIHIVRHPWAVMASSHKKVENYISLDRIESEHRAWLDHLATRENTVTIRYEDLVQHPEVAQRRIEELLQTCAAWPFAEFWRNSNLAPDIVSAMKGLRPLDPTSINAWRRQDGLRDHLLNSGALESAVIGEIGKRFDYDLSLN